MGKFEKLFLFDKKIMLIFGFLLQIKRCAILLRSRRKRKDNSKLKNLRRSDKCFVIGLGPSLKEIDLTKLNGDIIVTNRFNKIDNATKIKPIAYVLIDNFFYNGKYKGDLLQAVDDFSDSLFILNGLYESNIDKSVLQGVDYSFIYCWKGFLNGKKDNIDLTKTLPIVSNVTCAAEMVALYMGYKEINLLGCDFNSFASLNMNHAYQDKEKDRLWTMSNELFQYSFAADLHVQLDEYSRIHGQRIFNMTEGSLIDAYERKNCDEYKQKTASKGQARET